MVRRRRKPAVRAHSKMRTKFIHSIERWMFKKGRKIGHQIRGIPYRVVNSARGLIAMAKYGYPRADRDIRPDATNLVWVCHWNQPGLKDDMWNPSVPRSKKVDDMSPAEMRSLESPDGFHYHTLTEDFDLCKQKGIQPTIEPKSNRFTLEMFQTIKKEADARGLDLQGYALPQYARNVALMRQAGIPASYLPPR